MTTKAILTRGKKYAKEFLDYAKKHNTKVQKLIDANIDVQVHHVISVNSVKNLPTQCEHTLLATAYNINHLNNLAAFPSDLRAACYLKTQIHRGSHPKGYYDAVNNSVVKMLDKYNAQDCAKDAAMRTTIVRNMDDISQDVLTKINARAEGVDDEHNKHNYQLTKTDIYKNFRDDGDGCLGLSKGAKFEALRAAQKNGAKKCGKTVHEAEYPGVKPAYKATIGGK